MEAGMNPGAGQKGSMGIPDDMIEAGNRSRERQAKRGMGKKEPKPDTKVKVETKEASAPKVSDAAKIKENVEMTGSLNPIETLKKLGIEFNDDDLHDLLFKGVFEAKNINLIKGHFKASIRTLRSGEYHEVEELLADALEDNPNMTRAHYEQTQTSLIMAYAVTELDGKSPVRNIMDKDKNLDGKATAKAKHVVLMALSGTLLNKIIQTHSVIQTCVNLIAEDPDLLKK